VEHDDRIPPILDLLTEPSESLRYRGVTIVDGMLGVSPATVSDEARTQLLNHGVLAKMEEGKEMSIKYQKDSKDKDTTKEVVRLFITGLSKLDDQKP
jgi:hypothetical protein